MKEHSQEVMSCEWREGIAFENCQPVPLPVPAHASMRTAASRVMLCLHDEKIVSKNVPRMGTSNVDMLVLDVKVKLGRTQQAKPQVKWLQYCISR